jgi:lipoyl(octanoyl) transferase
MRSMHSAASVHLRQSVASGVADIVTRPIGRAYYLPTWRAMQDFTVNRNAGTPDELWVVEHPPVYTAGLAARPEHFPDNESMAIPVVHCDRGGQITYHGPGQAIVYALVDLARRGIKVREMVCLLEQAVIDLLAGHGVAAGRRSGAPGVYVAEGNLRGAKIAALGLKVKRQGCYHGVSLNVGMDLSPFDAIDPCGYPGQRVTGLRELGLELDSGQVGLELATGIARTLADHPTGGCAS